MDADVVVVGAGPVGLMAACELGLAGVQPVLLDRLAEPATEPKANGLVGQVVRLVDHRGLYEQLSGTAGPPRPNSAYFMFAALPLDLSLLDTSPIHTMPATQQHIVAVLTERAAELGVRPRRGHELVGLTQHDDAVVLDVAGPDGTYQLRTRYVIGADGAHSPTRKLAGIGFPGITYDRRTTRSAHVTVPDELVDEKSGALVVPGFGAVLPFLPVRTEHGGFAYAPLPGRPTLLNTVEWDDPESNEPMTLAELAASVRRVLGADLPFDPPFGAGPHVLRRLPGGNTRVAERFADGRVFLVGDAAHIYSSGGGQGLNLGLQDAVNLGWKLGRVLRGGSPELLDTYQAERGAAAHRMVLYSQAQSALLGPGSDTTALRTLVAELLGDRDTVQRLADLTAGADVRYPAAGSHPLAGAFVPELELHTEAGVVRLAELTRNARPLLVDLTPDGTLADEVTGEAVDVVRAKASADGLGGLLVRPDCYLAWAGGPDPGPDERAALRDAVSRWFG